MPQPADYIAAYAIIIVVTVFCICGIVIIVIAVASEFVKTLRKRHARLKQGE